MMYANKMAVAIKTNGRVLRENKDTVYCPFGAEYSILLKNLNTVRALVNVYIDGENQTPGGLVLNAHQEVDLQRSIKNGNLTEGNCFKFIERTGAVENHRGIKLEDGIIRVEYQYEFVYQIAYQPLSGITWYPKNDVYWTHDTHIGNARQASMSDLSNSTIYATNATISASYSVNDAGITVPGSISNQKFTTVSSFPLSPEKHSIVLKMLGETEQKIEVKTPITVKHKPKCVTCGKLNKHTNKFCSECGTSLTIVC